VNNAAINLGDPFDILISFPFAIYPKAELLDYVVAFLGF
jgi:hypothetical protein